MHKTHTHTYTNTANHILDPRIELAPNASATDTSWVWVAFDFAEGELEEKTFAIRFKNSDFATEFKTAFTNAQKEMKALFDGKDSTEGAKEADDLAGALDKVDVKSGEAEEEA
jgi:Ran-binding protein 1